MNFCPNNFNLSKKEHILSIPCCWNHPIDVWDEKIERAILVVHGVLRNADEYFLHMMDALGYCDAGPGTLVMAPQFLVEDDIFEYVPGENTLFWGGETGEGWKKGDESLSSEGYPRPATASSFEVVDRMIKQIATKGFFPNLNHVIVIGHSAGGQFVNRYAAGTRIGDLLPEEIDLRFIVANPSTYLYFTEVRHLPGTSNEFVVPVDPDLDFNEYKYGLDKLNRYMTIVGADTIRAHYPKKDVVYLLGGEDVKKAHLEQTPNAMLQGVNRLERGQIYYHYLKYTFGEEITHTQKIAIVPCVGHDHAAIFKSEAGQKYLFG